MRAIGRQMVEDDSVGIGRDPDIDMRASMDISSRDR